MPSIEHINRFQAALLWELAGRDEHADPQVYPALELRVRWVFKRREGGPVGASAAGGRQSENVTRTAEIHVDQPVSVGSIMFPGSLEEWLGTGSAGDASELYTVNSCDKTPDLKNRHVCYMLSASRFMDALPTIVARP